MFNVYDPSDGVQTRGVDANTQPRSIIKGIFASPKEELRKINDFQNIEINQKQLENGNSDDDGIDPFAQQHINYVPANSTGAHSGLFTPEIVEKALSSIKK